MTPSALHNRLSRLILAIFCPFSDFVCEIIKCTVDNSVPKCLCCVLYIRISQRIRIIISQELRDSYSSRFCIIISDKFDRSGEKGLSVEKTTFLHISHGFKKVAIGKRRSRMSIPLFAQFFVHVTAARHGKRKPFRRHKA